jgi:DNA-binding LacI/PurR family transcriptional regulator
MSSIMGKAPSMAEIARLAKVSKNTVSLALRRDPQIPESTRRKIERIAERLGYKKNPIVARLMAELRRVDPPGFKSCLAILNANTDQNAFRSHPTIPAYVEGCRRRANAQGYRLDEFWLHDPALDGARLNKILQARGIPGVLVVGLMRDNRLPERFLPTWREFPTVVTGVRTRDPALSFSCVDHHFLALGAFRQAIGLGYKRPALVLDPVIEELVDHRFSAGFQMAQQDLPPRDRIAPLLTPDDSQKTEAAFREWLVSERPDVLLILYNTVRKWVARAGLSVPRDLGIIQLEWRHQSSEVAGMNQHNDIVGEAAVEMLVGMILNNASGIPEFPRATLIGPSWVDGKSIRSSRSR